MARDERDQAGPGAAGAERREPDGGVSLKTSAVVLALTAVLTVAVGLVARWAFTSGPTAGATDKVPPGAPMPLFIGWPKPDLVLLLSAQQHGYLLPCGCSRPQRGGLERRYNFLQTLKQRGWPVVAVDLGDIAQTQGPQILPNVQGLIKYRYSMEALNLMDYLAVGIGECEGSLPLKEALDNYALNNNSPRVLCANLKDKETNFPDEVGSWKVTDVPGTNLKVGVTSVVGPAVAKAMGQDPQVAFEHVREALPGALKDMAKQAPDVRVLLYQGPLDMAKVLAEKIPDFQVILCLSPEDEASARPEVVGNTFIIRVGHKGKAVGVVGVFRPQAAGQPPELRYQQVSLGEEYMTPKGQEANNPVAQLMERYTQELKEGRYLEKYGQTSHLLQQEAKPPAFPTYVGSRKCQGCHKAAYAVWEKSQHAHAYHTLVDAKHPSLRQYDGECIVCHVTGFSYKGGFTDLQKTPKLIDVGCESCHGPGSEHIKHKNDEKWHALMNPWKAKPGETEAQKKRRLFEIDKACQKCHDQDNDVHWDFEKKWPKIAHPSPPDEN
jgi:hypothetical protein